MPEPIVSVDQDAMKSELSRLVRKTVQETTSGPLDERADELVGAGRHERTAARDACRAGHYRRRLVTAAGETTPEVPKLKGAKFTTAIIGRCRRREESVEEAMIGMRLAGVPARRIEDASEVPWGAGVSAGTVSNPSERAYKSVGEWRTRPLGQACPHVFVDGVYLKRGWGGAFGSVAVMVAIGVGEDGRRGTIGCAEGLTESSDCWRDFPSWPRSRGLRGVRASTGDKAAGMVGSIAEVFPEAKYRRRTVRFCRDVPARVPKRGRKLVGEMPRAIRARESREACEAKAADVADKPEGMRLRSAARCVREGFAETPAHARFPTEHWRRIRTNNAIGRLNREIRRRTRVVGTFPDGRSALMLVAARLRYAAESEWGVRRYLDVSMLESA